MFFRFDSLKKTWYLRKFLRLFVLEILEVLVGLLDIVNRLKIVRTVLLVRCPEKRKLVAHSQHLLKIINSKSNSCFELEDDLQHILLHRAPLQHFKQALFEQGVREIHDRIGHCLLELVDGLQHKG